jgi:N-acetyl-gamma-glutamyl-phosphate reductase
MDNKIKVGIIGGAGYTGGELIRILINHPNVSIVFVQSNSNADKPLHAVHQDLQGETNIFFTKEKMVFLKEYTKV